MMHKLLDMEIRFADDLVGARHLARQISGLLGFDQMEQARIATAVSEIARNAFNYAGGGHIEFSVDDGEQRHPLLEIAIRDQGPGIAHLDRILNGAVASGGGMGILSARRLMDFFQIDSEPGKGTRVQLTKRFPKQVTSVSAGDIARIGRELARRKSRDPLEEIRQQNQELVRAMQELSARQEELVRLNSELEDTNRGVIALYAELDDKAMHLRRADELKSRFLSNMSHEFRTPLNSILALSRLLLERVDGDLNDEQAKEIAFIQKSAQDLSDLVNDLLDLAKVEAGRVTVNPAEMDVANLFGGLRGMFRPLLINPNLSLIFDEPTNLPRLITDEGKVSQVLRNFISNALKFTECGQIVVRAMHDPARKIVTFSVSDTGIGIPPEEHSRIFEEFTQVDSAIQRKVKGTGLGLPLARKLTELLGGEIKLVSQPGAGSTFSAVLPLIYRGARTAAGSSSPDFDSTRIPILAVEDDVDSVMLYEKYLKGTGFQVIAANTVPQARTLLAEIRPAAIILDIMLPGGASWDFLIDLKRDQATREIPVFVVSQVEEMRKGLALGADAYFIKPLDRKRLLDRLRSIAVEQRAAKVLVVDDDEVSRYLLRDLLADTRYQTLEAAGGVEALRMAREFQPNVILLDLVMPDLDGLEVLERLEADPSTRDIPVIIVTSKALDTEERGCLSQKAVAILSKDNRSRQDAIQALRQALTRAEMLPRHV